MSKLSYFIDDMFKNINQLYNILKSIMNKMYYASSLRDHKIYYLYLEKNKARIEELIITTNTQINTICNSESVYSSKHYLQMIFSRYNSINLMLLHVYQNYNTQHHTSEELKIYTKKFKAKIKRLYFFIG